VTASPAPEPEAPERPEAGQALAGRRVATPALGAIVRPVKLVVTALAIVVALAVGIPWLIGLVW
jgi:hypothetical protein